MSDYKTELTKEKFSFNSIIMEIIGEYFYVILLIVGAIAQWVKTRADAKSEAEQAQKRAERVDQEEEEYFDLEEILQRAPSRPAVPPALPSGPLPGVERSPVPDLRRKNSVPPPVSAVQMQPSAIDSELQRQASLAQQVAALNLEKKKNKPENAAAAKARYNQLNSGQSKLTSSLGLKQRLRNRDEIRKAFVLKEILEKPVGLRSS